VTRKVSGLAVTLLFACGAVARAQTVNLWPGAPPGTESWTQHERVIDDTPIGTVILNVVTPTLTAFLPDRNKANGTAVIVAPGGACVALAIGLEGYDVARALAKRGIAAFVLKYRIIEKKGEGIPDVDMDAACKYGVADAMQAVKIVRQNAAAWGVAPKKIGVLGFSAGAMIVNGALLSGDAVSRPDFAGLIYGAPFGVMPAIPKKLPPIFMAWSQDANTALVPIVAYYETLEKTGIKPEAHIYSSGGHGFGLKTQGTTSDHWFDEYLYWLAAHGF
jgi:acetyl esterase/lipase